MTANTLELGALASISGVSALVLLVLWRSVDRRPAMLAWACASLAALLRWSCLLPGALDASGSGVAAVLADAFAILAVTLVLAGQRLHAGRAVHLPVSLARGSLILASSIALGVAAPDGRIAGWVVPLFLAVLLAIAAQGLLGRSGARVPARWIAAAFLALGALAELAAAPAAPDVVAARAPFALLVAHAGTGLAFLLLAASDLAARTERLALADPVTGVLNRRGFLDAALRALSQARRSGQPLALVVTDLDDFKGINDSYGHRTGDRALESFAAHLASELRQSDLVGRTGGGEFALLLVNADLGSGVLVAERLCRALGPVDLEVKGARIELAASFGVAALSTLDGDVEDLVERAGRGLYRAKEQGRRRVCAVRDDDAGPDFAVA